MVYLYRLLKIGVWLNIVRYMIYIILQKITGNRNCARIVEKIYHSLLKGGNSQVKYNLISEIVLDKMELTTARKN